MDIIQFHNYFVVCRAYSDTIRRILILLCSEYGFIFSICSEQLNEYLLTFTSKSTFLTIRVDYCPDRQLLIAPFSPNILVWLTLENINGVKSNLDFGHVYVGSIYETGSIHLKKKINSILIEYIPRAQLIIFSKFAIQQPAIEQPDIQQLAIQQPDIEQPDIRQPAQSQNDTITQKKSCIRMVFTINRIRWELSKFF